MPATVDSMVGSLVAAHRTHVPTPALHEVADLDATTAYTVQRKVFEDRFGRGAGKVHGYKMSLTNGRDQQAFGTDRPLYGVLAREHLLASPARLTRAALFRPIIEPEIVFRFDADLSPAASLDEVVEKSHVAAGFDLPDSRYAGWPALTNPLVTDLIADNACVGLIVHAEPAVRAADVDLPSTVCTMRVDGEVFGVGQGSDVSGNPAHLVVWLSKTLAGQGIVLRKGDRVSSGAVVAPSPLKLVEPGRFTAEFTGIGEVRLDVS